MKSRLNLAAEKIEKLPKYVVFIICFLLIPFLGILDYYTGYEFSFTVFYLVPIIICAYFTNNYYSFLISLVSALAWYFADSHSGFLYANKIIPVINSFLKFIIFLLVSYSFIKIKKLLEMEKELSRIDSLTGSYNRKFLYPVLYDEIERAKRYKTSVTVSYIDLDNFKKVNDIFGHDAGDAVLKKTVQVIKKCIRVNDSIIRMGGDEFIILFVNSAQKELKEVFKRLLKNLSIEMKNSGWTMVSFSIGVVSCRKKILTSEELIEKADALMYEVKKSGKNNIKYIEY